MLSVRGNAIDSDVVGDGFDARSEVEKEGLGLDNARAENKNRPVAAELVVTD